MHVSRLRTLDALTIHQVLPLALESREQGVHAGGVVDRAVSERNPTLRSTGRLVGHAPCGLRVSRPVNSNPIGKSHLTSGLDLLDESVDALDLQPLILLFLELLPPSPPVIAFGTPVALQVPLPALQGRKQRPPLSVVQVIAEITLTPRMLCNPSAPILVSVGSVQPPGEGDAVDVDRLVLGLLDGPLDVGDLSLQVLLVPLLRCLLCLAEGCCKLTTTCVSGGLRGGGGILGRWEVGILEAGRDLAQVGLGVAIRDRLRCTWVGSECFDCCCQ
mmetsp:Transcript_23076/g.66072  ORF Transcript_23076/g.66072 Transcript_23076/m.66072 type:complete len:274 (+) Transcript_23076:261-1082(+)